MRAIHLAGCLLIAQVLGLTIAAPSLMPPASADTQNIITWNKSPSQARIVACNQSLPSCPGEPADLGGGVWLNGIVLDEVMSNQGDPKGLGGYQLHIQFDPFVFQPASIMDLGGLSDGGVR